MLNFVKRDVKYSLSIASLIIDEIITNIDKENHTIIDLIVSSIGDSIIFNNF